MTPFFILGRPRSRTAWLANFLTVTPFSFCLHEGLADFGGSVRLLKRKLDAASGEAVGNADTGLIHVVDELLEAFPDSRFVVVCGTKRAWHLFASENYINDALVRATDESFAYTVATLRAHPRALFIGRDELDLPLKAQELWTHCLGSADLFDRARFEMLCGLNVQADNEALLYRIRQGCPHL